eukprot:g7806.t1
MRYFLAIYIAECPSKSQQKRKGWGKVPLLKSGKPGKSNINFRPEQTRFQFPTKSWALQAVLPLVLPAGQVTNKRSDKRKHPTRPHNFIMNIVKGQGLPDFCMLEKDKINEDEFLKNLKTRFDQKQIYTYIGEQLVAMNPFTPMPELYNENTLRGYRNRYMYEVQPHIFALGEDTYRALRQSKRDQCVIVTGESGAGKTEATKIFMQYISAVTIGDREGRAQRTNKKLLDSNPVLEAFGNAKTLRNDNSSRFGKYMEIQFSSIGLPLGGQISQYLLEKSRVVTRAQDERCFHIFYMLLTKSPSELKNYSLQPDPAKYNYLNLSKCYKVSSIKDNMEMATAENAMRNLGFSDQDFDSVWRILAGILNMGNIDYKLGKDPKIKTDHAELTAEHDCQIVADLLQELGAHICRVA